MANINAVLKVKALIQKNKIKQLGQMTYENIPAFCTQLVDRRIINKILVNY